MTIPYNKIDDLIEKFFGQPDVSTGCFLVDHGNLQAFAIRVISLLEEVKGSEK